MIMHFTFREYFYISSQSPETKILRTEQRRSLHITLQPNISPEIQRDENHLVQSLNCEAGGPTSASLAPEPSY